MPGPAVRIGVDLGGTKIAAIAIGPNDEILHELRIPTPRMSYSGTVSAIAGIVASLESELLVKGTVGIGIPGSVSPQTGLIQNANSTWLNGKPFAADLEEALSRPVRLANDANCFALSEAHDGAATGSPCVFGVIIGTGCGGGIVMNGKLHEGSQRIGGEWGHTPLPWQREDEHPGPECWCGRRGCLETWVSGPGMARDHHDINGVHLSANDVAARAAAGDGHAQSTLNRHTDRLARGLSVVVNVIDPDVIVLGGGLSLLDHLYTDLPDQMRPWIFSDAPSTTIVRARHGDASGVRGAARLW